MNAKNINAQSGKWAKNYPTFVRSGYVDLYFGYLRNANRESHYWASTATFRTSDARGLWFGPTGVNPSYSTNGGNRYYGFSLRCLQE